MDKHAKIYLAGHRGMVGSAILRRLDSLGYRNVITRSSDQLDLRDQRAVQTFFTEEHPDYVFLAAAKVGGIRANQTRPAEFIYDNLAIQTHVIHAACIYGVKKLLFLGSSCIYPREAPQPFKEEYLMTGPLEPTNEAYAMAKIAGIKMGQAYRRQYGTNFISAMPTNLYGTNDNYDLVESHVLAALIRKFHLAKLLRRGHFEAIVEDLQRFGNLPEEISESTSPSGIEDAVSAHLANHGLYPDKVALWGTGSPRREFLHVDDLAEACVSLMDHYDDEEIVNIGWGKDISIRELAELVREIVGFEGAIEWDRTKPDGTPRKLLDISRAKGLGWRPTIELTDGIRRVYRAEFQGTEIAHEN